MRAAALALVLLASGCYRKPETVTVTVPVQVPVPVPCPEPPPLAFPELDIKKLPPDATPDQIARAAAGDLRRLALALRQALALLDAYRQEGPR